MPEWRYRCPEGHASVTLRSTVFDCRACNATYQMDELTDLQPRES